MYRYDLAWKKNIKICSRISNFKSSSYADRNAVENRKQRTEVVALKTVIITIIYMLANYVLHQ